MESLLDPYTTQLQAGKITYGMCTNTIENGATVNGSVELTNIGSNDGIFPNESIVSGFPFSSIVWLCKSPSFAVKWYSCLVFDAIFLLLGSLIEELFLWLWCLCFLWCNIVPLKATLALMVVLPSRLINNKVIPRCKMEVPFFQVKCTIA